MLYIIFLFIFSSVSANGNLDSLQNLLSKGETQNRFDVLNEIINISLSKNDITNSVKYTDQLVFELNLSSAHPNIKYYLTALQAYKDANELNKFVGLAKNTLSHFKNYDNPEFVNLYKLITNYYYFNGKYNYNLELIIPKYKSILSSSDTKTKALFVRSIAQNYIMTGSLDSALTFANKNLEFRKLLKDTAALGHAYNSIGVIYWKLGDLLNAYLNYTKAEKFCKAGKDTSTLLLTYNNLGLVFQRLKYYKKAKEYMQEGLVLAKTQQNYYGIAYAYRRLADLDLELNNFTESKTFLDSSLTYYKIAKRDLLITDVYYLYGKLYQAEGKFDKALKYYNLGLENKDNILDKFVISLLLTKRGEIYINTGKYDFALKDVNEALDISSGNRYSVILRDNYFNLYKINKALKKFEESVLYLEKYNELKEQLLNESIVNLINERDIKSSIEKSTEFSIRLKKENELQKTIIQNNKLINYFYGYIFIISLIALFIIAYQLFKVRKLNNKIKIQNINLVTVNDQLIEKNKLLEKANETKHKLFSIIAHDLKNPFFSILGFANIIKEQAEESGIKGIKNYSEILLSASFSLVDMIDNLSKWAKLQQEKIMPTISNFNIYEEFETILSQNSANIKLKSISIIKNFSSDNFINADKDMTSTIIRNLLSNAIKFTPEKGTITISCNKTDNEVFFAIKDSGRGISEEMIEAILSNKTINSSFGTNNEKGSGIGLSVCKDFINSQNGTLSIISSLGNGAEFIVKLPLN